MPHTLEGFKLAEESGMRSGRLIVAMMFAAVVGILASFWAYLLVGYNIGVVSDLGTGGYNLLQNWISHPTETDAAAVTFIGVGALFTGCPLVASDSVSVLALPSCGLSCGW